jgi:DNA-binding MarR family transcriptional regulator
MATSRTRLANEAWEALFRAQATLAREFSDAEVWGDLGPSEYGVLYALSTAPGPARICDLQEDVLLTQTGMSRLIARMEARGLVLRSGDPDDGRAYRIQLTELGAATQREIGLRHGRHVAEAMTRALGREQLLELEELCQALLTAAQAAKLEVHA